MCKISLFKCVVHGTFAWLNCVQFQVKDDSAAGEPSSSTNTVADPEDSLVVDDDDDELDMDELNELEASLSRTSIQIREPGIEA